MNPSIIIADDHPLILKGLQEFLAEKGFNVLASAKNGKEALTLIKAHTPDIAILDITMPFYTGLEIAEKCNAENLQTKIVFITLEKDKNIYDQSKALGAYGYVLKEFALEEIENCISAVQKNRPYFSPELLSFLEADQLPAGFHTLTIAERNVLKLIAENKTAKEIAEELFVSNRTIEKHKSHIRKRLKLDSKSTSMVLFAKKYKKFL